MVLAVVGVLFLAATLVVCFMERPPSKVQLMFLGYTNAGTGDEAVFSVQFPPGFGGCGWREPKVSRKEGAVWKDWTSTNTAQTKVRAFNGPIKRSAFGAEPRTTSFMAFAVETTNVVSRIVIQVDEQPHEWLVERAGRMLWVWITKRPKTPNGRSYFITNETTIASAASQTSD